MLVRTLIISTGSLLIFKRSIENELPQGFMIVFILVMLLYAACEILDYLRKTKQAKKIMDSGKKEILENLSKRLSK
jgi:transcription initiation factor TFIIIB Brf1 subunit/transcription initiation factor TFIIB